MPYGFDPTAAYHDYTIEWTSRFTKFYVDGKIVKYFTSVSAQVGPTVGCKAHRAFALAECSNRPVLFPLEQLEFGRPLLVCRPSQRRCLHVHLEDIGLLLYCVAPSTSDNGCSCNGAYLS